MIPPERCERACGNSSGAGSTRTAERKFDDVFSRGTPGEIGRVCTVHEESCEIPAREAPVERTRDGLVVALKAEDAPGDSARRGGKRNTR